MIGALAPCSDKERDARIANRYFGSASMKIAA
jgi:hypothetical protein